MFIVFYYFGFVIWKWLVRGEGERGGVGGCGILSFCENCKGRRKDFKRIVGVCLVVYGMGVGEKER